MRSRVAAVVAITGLVITAGLAASQQSAQTSKPATTFSKVIGWPPGKTPVAPAGSGLKQPFGMVLLDRALYVADDAGGTV
jgi:hypothetical protein